MKPTQEQINNSNALADTKKFVIKALAGTGKSTNVRFIGNKYPDKNFLVITFSKANADESNSHSEKPKNVHYCTVNSIAFKTIVAPEFKYKIAGFLNFYDMAILPRDLKTFSELNFSKFPKDIRESKTRKIFQEIIACSITKFCQSAFDDVEKGLDYYVKSYIDKQTLLVKDDGIFIPTVAFSDNYYKLLKKKTLAYWDKLVDPNNNVMITHDVYLKLYDLDKVKIEYYNGVKIDTIIVDEAQDSNGVILSVFERQKHLQQVMLGDEYQTIYSWRGAKNAMKTTKEKVGYLTNSFRFNQAIADKANKVLKRLGSEIFLTGLSTKTEIKTKAYLSRTNIGVLEYVLGQSEKVYVTIDFTPLKTDLRYISDLKRGRDISKTPKKFSFINSLEEYNNLIEIYTDLKILDNLYKFLDEKHGGIETALQRLDSLIEKNPSKTNEIATTIHKAKGLEWDMVTISEDYIPNSVQYSKKLDDKGKEIPTTYQEKIEMYFEESEERLRLLYVAITRAKVIVHTPSDLNFMFY